MLTVWGFFLSVHHIYLTTYTLKKYIFIWCTYFFTRTFILFDVFYRSTMCVVNNRIMEASAILKLFSVTGKRWKGCVQHLFSSQVNKWFNLLRKLPDFGWLWEFFTSVSRVVALTRCLQHGRWEESNLIAQPLQDLNNTVTSGEWGTMESRCLFGMKMERRYLQMEHCEDVMFLTYRLVAI